VFEISSALDAGVDAIHRRPVSEDTGVPIELSARERVLILEHTFAGDDLLDRLRGLPTPGRHAADFTLYEIEDLQGFAAAEANHNRNRELADALSALYERLGRELERYDDGNWQTSPGGIG